MTTGGGLYRYRMRDRVRVVGFVEATPALEFLGKEEGVSDLRGEKLSEGFVTKVLSKTLGKWRIDADFAMLAPESAAAAGRYSLFIEAEGKKLPGEFAGALDSAL